MTEIRAYLRGLPVFAGELPEFDPALAPPEPGTLFVEWLTTAVAAGVLEPQAMTLSTIGRDGVPAARVLILKNVDAEGWQFAVHAASPKGQDLIEQPVAALTFHWPEQARQVRVRGHVRPESAERSAADFLARPIGSRAEAMAGRQSQPLGNRQDLDLSTKISLQRIEAEPGLVVEQWTLYTLRPDQVEFWQGDKQRKHTRLRYLRDGDSWTRQMLWP